MKKFLGIFLALVLILSVSIPAAGAANIYPQDAGNSTHKDDILAVYNYGGLNGLVGTDGNFGVGERCSTRGFATILANLFGTRYITPSNYKTSAITQGEACDMMTDVSRQLSHKVTFDNVTRNAKVDRGEACALIMIMLRCDNRLVSSIVNAGGVSSSLPTCGGNGYYYGARFNDVPVGSWCYDAVEWAVNNGITSGTSSTTFSPSSNVTVAQWFMFLWRANGSPSSRSSCPFGGVTVDSSFYTALCWAGDKGLVTNDRIDPFSTVATRADVIWSMWKVNGSPYANQSISFRDVTSSNTYYNAVRWGVRQGIVSGTSSTTFSPLDPLSRGAAVTMLYRCYRNNSYSNSNSGSSGSSSSNNWYYYNGEKFYTGVWYPYGDGWLYNGGWYTTRNAA